MPPLPPRVKQGEGKRERQDKAAGNVKISSQHMGWVTGVSELAVYVSASSHRLFHRVRRISTKCSRSTSFTI